MMFDIKFEINKIIDKRKNEFERFELEKCFIFVVSHIHTQTKKIHVFCIVPQKKPGWPSLHCVYVCVFVVSMFVLGSGLG